LIGIVLAPGLIFPVLPAKDPALLKAMGAGYLPILSWLKGGIFME
jgi:hypothetical protein